MPCVYIIFAMPHDSAYNCGEKKIIRSKSKIKSGTPLPFSRCCSCLFTDFCVFFLPLRVSDRREIGLGLGAAIGWNSLFYISPSIFYFMSERAAITVRKENNKNTNEFTGGCVWFRLYLIAALIIIYLFRVKMMKLSQQQQKKEVLKYIWLTSFVFMMTYSLLGFLCSRYCIKTIL